MSVQAVSWVWDHSEHKGGTLLVFLALADHMNAQGGGCWTGTEFLAAQCRLSERQIQRAISSLRKTGEIVVAYKGGPHGTNLYSIPALSPGQNDTVTPTSGNPDTHVVVTPTPTSPEPSVNRQEPSGVALGSSEGSISAVSNRPPSAHFDSGKWHYLLKKLYDRGWSATGQGALTWPFLMRLQKHYGTSIVDSALSEATYEEAPPLSAAPYLESICVRLASVAV